MQGIVLGYSVNDETGVIIAEEKRYTFSKDDWKENRLPQKGMEIDFVAMGSDAKDIYIVAKDIDSTTMLGLISLAITFLLGFIGTLISRMVISKHDFSDAMPATFGHLIITILAFIPLLGWVIYVVGTIYFMVKNYQLVLNPQGVNRYE